MLHRDSFLCLALPNWNAFTERLVPPLPAASHLPPSHFFSLMRLYFHYESLWPILVFNERAPRLPHLLCHFRFGQSWSETKTLQILPENVWVYSPAHVLFILLERFSLHAVSLFGTRLSTVVSTLSSPCSTFDLPSLSPRCGTRSPWLSPTTQFGDLDWLICSFFFWQRRLWRTCQLLTLWRWGHSFLFGRPRLLKFFRWSLHHSASFPLASAAPTSLPLLFFPPTLALS